MFFPRVQISFGLEFEISFFFISSKSLDVLCSLSDF